MSKPPSHQPEQTRTGVWGKGGGPGPSGRGRRELLTLFRGLVKGATNPQSPSVGPGREKGQVRLCHDQRNPGPSYSTRACWKFYRSTYEVCNLKQNNLKPSVCPSPPSALVASPRVRFGPSWHRFGFSLQIPQTFSCYHTVCPLHHARAPQGQGQGRAPVCVSSGPGQPRGLRLSG